MSPYFDQEEEFDERRKNRRWNIPVPVRVKGTLPDGAAFEEECITTDANAAGMCVLLSKEVQVKDSLVIVAPEEKFESPAMVISVDRLGANLNRVRVNFTPPATFNRRAATKKYIYDFAMENWVGYMSDGVYYNSKHLPFGCIQGSTIRRADSEQILFHIKGDRVYDNRGNCIGHII
jgi:hypothetical protein